jgi:toxin ParE1/3/4
VSIPVIMSPAADDDLLQAVQYYELQRRGLGMELVARVENTLKRIGDNPDLYPEVKSGIRRAPVRRFPYGVFYRRRSNYIQVIAIVHDAHDAAIWQARV